MAKKKTPLRRIQFHQIFLKKHFEHDSRDPADYIMIEEIAWLKQQGFRMRVVKPHNQKSEWMVVEYHFWVPEWAVSYLVLKWPNSTHEYEVE